MKLIVISHPGGAPGSVPDEASIINQLFENGLEILHLRKPECHADNIKRLLGEINPDFLPRIALHQNHDLAPEFGIHRLHFTEKERSAKTHEQLGMIKNRGIILSTSIHDVFQLGELSDHFDYAFFGPLFNSISKKGYEGIVDSNFKLPRKTVDLIALGGIDNANVEMVLAMDFDGVAVLGALWEQPADAVINFSKLQHRLVMAGAGAGALSSSSVGAGASSSVRTVASSSVGAGASSSVRTVASSSVRTVASSSVGAGPRLKPGVGEIGRLHFISGEVTGVSHLRGIEMALDGGCNWVQLRVKNQPEEDVLGIAFKAKKLCDDHNARLIINDYPHIARAVDAYGLHLGLNDTTIPAARAIVGKEMVIGGTANTFEDIILRIQEGADYVGLGPYRFTSTKQNLSPILGLEGYHQIFEKLKQAHLEIPIIAIGGITPEDVHALKHAGVHGIAMSAALIRSENINKTVSNIYSELC